MKIQFFYFLFPLLSLVLSCKREDKISVSININKNDSTLIVKYFNPNSTNYYIDFTPEFHDKYFEIAPNSKSKDILILDFIPKSVNKEDSLISNQFRCAIYNTYEKNSLYRYPIYLKSKSSKVYSFKIKNYLSGKQLEFKTSENPYQSFLMEMKTSNSNNEIKKLIYLNKYKCENYKYFTGQFTYNPNAFILP